MQQESLSSYIKSLILKYKYYILLLLLMAVVAAILEVHVNYKIKEIIDNISFNKGDGIGYLLLIFALFKFCGHGMHFLRRVLDVHYRSHLLNYLILNVYKNTVGQSLHWFDSHMSGEVSSKIVDIQNGIFAIISASFTVVINIVLIITSIFFLAQIHIQPVLIILIFIVLYTPIIGILLQKQLLLQDSYVASRQKAVGIINDTISNIWGVKVIGGALNELKMKLQPALRHWCRHEKKTRAFDAYVVDAVDTTMVTIMSVAQIYCITYLYQQDAITSGEFAFIAMVTLRMNVYLNYLLEYLLFTVNPNIAQVKHSYNLLHSKYDVYDKPKSVNLSRVKGKIDFNNIDFAYGKGRSILKDFCLSIPKGQRLGIVGTSGAGKTTLVKCILRYF